jgi:pimeloyl-ACP methyl ester carboxylesterase
MRQLRVLCLHGYHGSGDVLRRQMAPLASTISDVEFVYVDAPSLAENDFGWWHSPAQGWHRTRDWAVDLFASQPRFDGVFGFSQGAAFTGLLAGMRQEAVDGPGTGILFDFAVLVGGFKNDAPEHADLYRNTFTVPSVHIIGRTDTIIPPHESRDLAAQFANPSILQHPGGHVVPADALVVERVTGFLDRMRGGSRQLASADGPHEIR